MSSERGDVASEQALGEVRDHRVRHRLLAHRRAVDEAPSLRAVHDDALFLHLLEHRRDRGGGEAVRDLERAMHVDHRALAVGPELAHDRELQISEMDAAWHEAFLLLTTAL